MFKFRKIKQPYIGYKNIDLGKIKVNFFGFWFYELAWNSKKIKIVKWLTSNIHFLTNKPITRQIYCNYREHEGLEWIFISIHYFSIILEREKNCG